MHKGFRREKLYIRYKLYFQTDEVTLLLADNLPVNNYTQNAFRNSFFYQRARRILFVRSERVSSVGELVMVVIHCMAHIAVGQLEDDSDPYFLRAFYKVSMANAFLAHF